MDKGLKIIIILTAVMLCLTHKALSQCSEPIQIVYVGDDSCKVVQMGMEDWGYYYTADKNLKAIHDSIPKLSKGIEKERAINDSIQAAKDDQIDTHKQNTELLLKNRSRCFESVGELEVQNLYLNKSIDDIKKNRKWWFLGGGLVTIGVKLLLSH